jgi:hypothetical protein
MYSVVVKFPRERPLLRIGELSRRLGVSDHVLRAWEDRYGMLQPVRSPGGLRLMVFGIVLHRNGWRIGYPGTGTRPGSWSGPSTARILTWPSWPLPARRPSSPPPPGPAPRRRPQLRREPG